jgi:c-di-GMP-binding flagellar brake protein YcgR
MRGIVNNRNHDRVPLQVNAQCGLMHEDVVESAPPLIHRPTLANLSFGGMRLLFVPSLQEREVERLRAGKSNLFLEFMLPPSTRPLQTTLKIKWVRKKKFGDTIALILGAEFVTKTQTLYREIDGYFQALSPSSVLYKDRRFFPRIPLNLDMKFTIQGIKKLGWFQQIYDGEMVNISAVGLRLKPKTNFSRKTVKALRNESRLLYARFNVNEIGMPLTVTGRPVYLEGQKRDEIPAQPQIGLKFTNLSENHQGRLIEYVTVKRQQFLRQEIDAPSAS